MPPKRAVADVTAEEGPVRAVAYVRCSSDRQSRQDSSIPAQRAEITRRAEADGAVVVRWFEDDGISGKNVEDRPGLNALLDWVSAHKGAVSRFYVYDSKRMARNRAEAFSIRKDLKRAKVQLIALAQPSVEDEAANVILESMWDGIAEAERLNLAKVVKRGIRQALVDGWWPFSKAPYGFRIIGEMNHKGAHRFKLLPDPDTAEIVRHIFALYVEGNGFKRVARILDAEGVPSPSSKSAPRLRAQGWLARHILYIVGDRRYTGAVEVDGVVVNPTHHPAIITSALYEQAQGLARARKRHPNELASLNNSKSENGVFRPWLKCAACGGTMVLNRGGHAEKRFWYYTCSTRFANTNACSGMTVRTDVLDAALLDIFETSVLTTDRIKAMVGDAITRMQEDAGGGLRERRAHLEARVKDLSARLGRLAGAIADGSMEMEDITTLSAPLRRQREEAREELANLPEPEAVPTMDEIDPSHFREMVVGRWRYGDITVQRKALDRVIDEIRLEPGIARIRYSWKTESCAYTYSSPQGPPYLPMSSRLPSSSS